MERWHSCVVVFRRVEDYCKNTCYFSKSFHEDYDDTNDLSKIVAARVKCRPR